jgi:hypothetical protein
VLGEPVFQSSILPWHNLFFIQWWQQKRSQQWKHLLPTDDDGSAVMTTVPARAHIYAMAIDLKDLWKIRAPVRTTQGLDLLHFDQLMEVAIHYSRDNLNISKVNYYYIISGCH